MRKRFIKRCLLIALTLTLGLPMVFAPQVAAGSPAAMTPVREAENIDGPGTSHSGSGSSEDETGDPASGSTSEEPASSPSSAASSSGAAPDSSTNSASGTPSSAAASSGAASSGSASSEPDGDSSSAASQPPASGARGRAAPASAAGGQTDAPAFRPTGGFGILSVYTSLDEYITNKQPPPEFTESGGDYSLAQNHTMTDNVTVASWEKLTLKAGGTLGGSGVLTIAPGGEVIVSGGSLEVDVVLGGTLTFSTDNTYGGSLTAGGGMLYVGAGTSLTLNGVVSGTGQLIKDGTGTLVLNNTANSYSDGTVVDNGTLVIAADACLGAAGGALTLDDGTLEAGDDMAINRPVTLAGTVAGFDTKGHTLTLDGLVDGNGILNKYRTGTLVLNNTLNSYSGATTVLGGALALRDVAALGQSPSLFLSGGGALRAEADLNLGNRNVVIGVSGAGVVDTNGHTVLIEGTISGGHGSFGLTKTGAGTLTLTGTNTYMGGTTVTGGTLAVGEDAALGNAGPGPSYDTYSLTLDGGALRATAALSLNRPLVLGAGGGTLECDSDIIATGAITGGGALTKTGVSAFFPQSNSNSYSGGTVVLEGMLSVSNNGQLGGAAGGLTLNGGTLRLSAADAFTRSVTLGTAGGTLHVNTSSTARLLGATTGPGALTVASEHGGTLLLYGMQHEGNTTVASGTLKLGNSTHVDPTATLQIDPGATLHIDTTAQLRNEGRLHVEPGATLNNEGTLRNEGMLLYEGRIDNSNLVENSGIIRGRGSLDSSNSKALGALRVEANSGLVDGYDWINYAEPWDAPGVDLAKVSKPVRTGYAFLGWYTAADGGSEVTGVQPFGSTVWAHWQSLAVTGVTLNEREMTLYEGQGGRLTATVAPANALEKGVRWSSSDESVATVDANGGVVGKKAGKATITATTVDGNFVARCPVSVKAHILLSGPAEVDGSRNEVFVFDGDFSGFAGASLDGVRMGLQPTASGGYTLTSTAQGTVSGGAVASSARITLNAALLEGLSPGAHNLSVYFDYGNGEVSGSATFTRVSDAPSGSSSAQGGSEPTSGPGAAGSGAQGSAVRSPQTGDTGPLPALGLAALACAGVIAATAVQRRRKRG
ncbi:autotransporter-associated beta strand repeat-containing protein [Ruminococcaceae bacterium OttesenSCG-928-I18]|nr:autotransporter-associated beta strand repeat-containing protein [Ruminococcaceae bacterium OttesenSCG-928-I18]